MQADELGKRMVMPVRFAPPVVGPQDYVVLALHDFAELLDLARERND